jgi:hypothetical protein
MQTTFADTVLNISVTGPLVRLDLGTVVPGPAKDGQQELVATPTQQLVMPLEGFVRAFGMQEALVKKLIAEGVLTVQAPETTAPNAPATAG